ncbi:unnamed protein product [Gongylonema pulchrum]|uniref:RNB domain-containing protein n=1 Tax=Gongylonema pulchrum TaxID=637853 RepID=A0A183ER52_9BILA|nr:unnamed protein product [Gongylonema pulchrum]
MNLTINGMLSGILGFNGFGLKLYKSLGLAGDIEAETEGLLLANDIDTREFSSSALSSLPITEACEWKIDEVGVHIADVSHFVQSGTELDHWAYSRGTSVYLVHKVSSTLNSFFFSPLLFSS